MSSGRSRKGGKKAAARSNAQKLGKVAPVGASAWETELRRLGVAEADAVMEIELRTTVGLALRRFAREHARVGYVPEAVLAALGLSGALARDLDYGFAPASHGWRLGRAAGLGE